MQARLTIEFEILACVENVEACHPESHGGGEQQNSGIEGPADRNPCRGRRDPESESQHQM